MDINEARALLKVDERATRSKIRKAYIEHARKHHPDKHGSTAAFQEIATAHELLLKELESPPKTTKKNRKPYISPDQKCIIENLKGLAIENKNLIMRLVDAMQPKELIAALEELQKLPAYYQSRFLRQKDCYGFTLFTSLSLKDAKTIIDNEQAQMAIQKLVTVIEGLPPNSQLDLFLQRKPAGVPGKEAFEALYQVANEGTRKQLRDMVERFGPEHQLSILLYGIPDDLLKEEPDYILSCIRDIAPEDLEYLFTPTDYFGESVKGAAELLAVAVKQHDVEMMVKIANAADDNLFTQMLQKTLVNPMIEPAALIPLIPRMMRMEQDEQSDLFQKTLNRKTITSHSAFKMAKLLLDLKKEANTLPDGALKEDILAVHADLEAFYLNFLNDPTPENFRQFRLDSLKEIVTSKNRFTSPTCIEIWKAFFIFCKTGQYNDFIQTTNAIYTSRKNQNIWKKYHAPLMEIENEMDPKESPSPGKK